MTYLIVWLLISGGLGYLVGRQAERYRRSFWAFFALSVLLSPLVSWVILKAITYEKEPPY
jgi:hypothetical protein